MGEIFKADPGVLEGMARTLRDAGTSLNSVGGSAPGTPDAGELSGDMARLMSQFAGAAGELVLRVSAAGDAVAEGGETYVETDDSAGSFEGVPGAPLREQDSDRRPRDNRRRRRLRHP